MTRHVRERDFSLYITLAHIEVTAFWGVNQLISLCTRVTQSYLVTALLATAEDQYSLFNC